MNRRTKLFIILVTGIMLTGCAHTTGKIIAIKTYDYKGDFSALTYRWKAMGINTAFISTGLAANDTFRQALKKNKFGVYIIFRFFRIRRSLSRIAA